MGKYFQQQDETELSHKIYTEQLKNNYPGLAIECLTLAKECEVEEEYGDDHVNSIRFKSLMKNKIKMKNEKEIISKMKTLRKLEHLTEEPFECKDYIKELNLEQIRMKFRLRTKMVKTKMNMKNLDANWLCNSCETAIDNQSHLIWCPAYTKLREGKNLESDKDLIDYFTKVLKIVVNITKIVVNISKYY